MVDEHEVRKHRARFLSQTLYDLSKRWWWTSIACKLGVFVVGAVIVLWVPGLKYGAVLIFMIYLAAELSLLRSDWFRGRAETILRKLDFEESFDWKISGAEMSDYELRSPARVRRRLPSTPSEKKYFASSEPFGPRRAAENVLESSFWSKHQAERMGNWCLAITCLLLTDALIAKLCRAEYARNTQIFMSFHAPKV